MAPGHSFCFQQPGLGAGCAVGTAPWWKRSLTFCAYKSLRLLGFVKNGIWQALIQQLESLLSLSLLKTSPWKEGQEPFGWRRSRAWGAGGARGCGCWGALVSATGLDQGLKILTSHPAPKAKGINQCVTYLHFRFFLSFTLWRLLQQPQTRPSCTSAIITTLHQWEVLIIRKRN